MVDAVAVVVVVVVLQYVVWLPVACYNNVEAFRWKDIDHFNDNNDEVPTTSLL
jgi:hypothetical protein